MHVIFSDGSSSSVRKSRMGARRSAGVMACPYANFRMYISNSDYRGPYNKSSVMHYPANAFVKPNTYTLWPLSCVTQCATQLGGALPNQKDVNVVFAVYNFTNTLCRNIDDYFTRRYYCAYSTVRLESGASSSYRNFTNSTQNRMHYHYMQSDDLTSQLTYKLELQQKVAGIWKTIRATPQRAGSGYVEIEISLDPGEYRWAYRRIIGSGTADIYSVYKR